MNIALRTVVFTAFLISIPMYTLYLGTLIRFRNKKPFSTPFFTICVALGLLDIVGLLNTWFLANFPTYGWFGMDIVVKMWPSLWSKVFKTTAFWNGFGSTTSVLLMAFNRMTNIVFPLRHQLIWNHQFMKIVVFLQIGLPLILTSPLLATELDYHKTNETKSLGPVIFLDAKYHLVYYSFAFLYTIAANIASFLMYLIIFCEKRINRVSTLEQSTPVATGSEHTEVMLRKIQKKMVIFGLVMFLLLSLVTVYIGLMITTKDPAKLAIYLQLRAVFLDIYSWINPYLALALSHTIREHFKAFVLCRQIEEEEPIIVKVETKPRQRLQPRSARVFIL